MNKIQNINKISVQEIKELCYKIAQEITVAQKDYDYIVGVNRGGIIPLGYLSYFLDNRNTKILDISLYGNDEEPDTSHEKIQIERKKIIKFLSSLKKEKKDPKVLIIDDLTDTGSTLDNIQIINEAYFDFKIDYAVLYHNPKGIFEPDFYGKEKPEGWLEFPWDWKGE
jgi:hypoxanthine phosphoribosyltransferase